MSTQIYLNEIRNNLPRLLGRIDCDLTSDTYGIGDRYYWAWGLIDFGNGTFQGMANGLARLWIHKLWPYETTKDKFFRRIDSLFQGARKLTRSDGSLEEAFPNEGSFCVTALVAFDLLVALDLLGEQVDEARRKEWEASIRPMIGYLLNADETHAVISNHLATAVAALVRWHHLTGDANAEARGRKLLDYILRNQSKEGWFLEYRGADPGYQSLCTYYLADVHHLRPDWQTLEPLRRSITFLWHFAHPDGSFGGLYGSRCTRFYYPAGILALADQIPEAAALAAFMAKSIEEQRVVTLSSIDEPNLVPMFNAYCWAATLTNQQQVRFTSKSIIPALRPEPLRLHFEEAGIVVDRGEGHYSIVAINKGGVVYHFAFGSPPLIDSGVIVRNAKGNLGSSQGFGPVESKDDEEELLIIANILPMPKRSPEPWQFIIIRLMCVTVFRFPMMREWVKQALVRHLITGGVSWPLKNRRIIKYGKNLSILDSTDIKLGYEIVNGIHDFVPIHMASQGYWQRQDEYYDPPF